MKQLFCIILSIGLFTNILAQDVWVNHYDDRYFPVSDIVDVAFSNHNLMWIAYYGNGMKAFNGNEVVAEYTTENGLKSNYVVDVFCKNDSVFIVQDKSLSVLYKGKITHLPVPELTNEEEFGAFYIDAQNRRWLTSDYGKIIRYNASLTKYEIFDFSEIDNAHYLFYFTDDYQGNTWFASIPGMVLKYTGDTFVNIAEKYNLEFLTFNDFLPTDTCMYIADETGFYKIKENTAECILHTKYNKKDDDVYTIRSIEQNGKDTYVYTFYGIFKADVLSDTVIFRPLTAEMNDIIFTDFYEMKVAPDSTIWVTTDNSGIYHIINFNVKRFTPKSLISGISDDYLYDNIINIEKGVNNSVLVEMVGFFAVLDTKTDSFRIVIPSVEDGSDISGVFPLDSNYTRFWLATLSSGMEYVDLEKGIYNSYCQCGSSNSMSTIKSAVQLGIDSFFTFFDTHLAIFHKNKFTFLKIKKDNSVDLSDNYLDSAVYKDLQFYNIVEKDGKIYIASSDGVYVWDGKKMDYWYHPDLENRSIDQLLFDQNGNAWLYTYQGDLLCYYIKKDKVVDYTHKIHPALRKKNIYLSQHENEIWLDLYQKFVIDNTSEIKHTETYLSTPINNMYQRLEAAPLFIGDWVYISSGKELIKFPFSLLQKNTKTPELELLSVFNLIDSSYVKNSSSYGYNQNSFKINLSVNEYLIKPENIVMQYALLKNGDTVNWQNISGSEQLLLSNLSPGNYAIALRSKYIDGKYAIFSQEINFTVSPPWYNTWWFYLLLLLLIVFSVYQYFLFKHKQAIKENEIKQQIAQLQGKALQAQMNPHFIFNILNTVQFHVLENDTKQTLQVLSKFSKLIRLTFDLVGEEKISLHKEIEYLKNYIEVEALRLEGDFKYQINTSSNVNLFDIKIPPLLIQPYVENVFKHAFDNKISGEARLEISFTNEKNKLIIIIKDNGKGGNILPENKGIHATSLTQNRFELLNEQMKQQIYSVNISSDESGTTVIIEIKL